MSEQLPDKNGVYLVCLENGKVFTCCFDLNFKQYDENGKFYSPAWPDENLGGKHKDVSHWMHLPQAPKLSFEKL